MTTIRTGDTVVCIDADFSKQSTIDQGIRKGETYVARWVGEYRHYIDGTFIGIKLVGIDRGADPGGYGGDDMPFHARRFRPVVKPRMIGKVKEEELV